MTMHPQQRRELGARLRTLREARGISTWRLAERLDISQSMVSRIDRGLALAKPDVVKRWAQEVGAPIGEQQALVALAESAAVRLPEWRRELARGRRSLQNDIGLMETAASVVREFGMDVVPGLLQTAAYAEVMFRLGEEHVVNDEDSAAVVEARVARQAVLDDTGKRYRLLCTETAFRRNLLDRRAMVDQVEHVLEAAQRTNVEVGVIPFRARERTHTHHAFAVLGEPAADDGAIVLVETVTRGLTIRAENEVAAYIAHFEQLARQAVTGTDLPGYLREVVTNAPWA
ncbi:helix-turn-helix domain-containing protein [Actinophytocola sp.]|uniref:helix-turn-helix domain-containing protein n=1 Tax=Actinophytocola sp. TaxID=1872138 RepID=UPI002ED6A299